MTLSATFELPWPPSVNTYWRQWRGRTLLSATGRQFKIDVWAAVKQQRVPNFGVQRLKISIALYPPDRRLRDIDNVGGKAVLDALKSAGVFDDDEQVDDLHIVRQGMVKGGTVLVCIESIATPTTQDVSAPVAPS